MLLDLVENNDRIERMLCEMFDALMNCTDRPHDDTERTGIQCCIKIPHGEIIMPKAYNPSVVNIHLASEKIVRAYEHGYYSSRVDADFVRGEYPGGLVIYPGNIYSPDNNLQIHCGTDGMENDENEMISFVLLTQSLKSKNVLPGNVLRMIYPDERAVPAFITDTKWYIWKTLFPFCSY
jgi:hypothetical protein